jgi:hypothetical protein
MTTRDLKDIALAISTGCCWAVESLDTGRRGSSCPQGLEEFGAAPNHFAGILEPAPTRLAAQKDVVGHVQIGAKVEFLVDERDAILSRVLSIGQGDGLAGDSQLAAVRRDDAAQDLHQGALADAILANEHVHLAGKDLEVHPIQDPRDEFLLVPQFSQILGV